MQNKTSIIILLLFLFKSNGLCQADTISPKEVVSNYLEKIGGFDKLRQVSTLEVISSQIIGGKEYELRRKLILPDKHILERKSENQLMKAIVNDSAGVNITQEGIFSMPSNQIISYKNDLYSIDEINYLESQFPMTYNGILNLDDDTQCYEIGITLPNGKIIYKEYNVKSGLLELIYSGREKIRIHEYGEFDGIKFPIKYSTNGRQTIVESILVNKEINVEEFEWNNNNDYSIIGRWEATRDNNEKGQSQVNYLSLNEDRSGKEGIAIVENGVLKEVEFLSFNIVGWEWDNDNLKLNYYDSQNKKLWSKILIIEKWNIDSFSGYISDPELDSKLGQNTKPASTEYKKVE